SKLWVDVATAVHYYEAILATLAILVWHFYHVIFKPGIYPMNWSWLTGKISPEQQVEEHPLETPPEQMEIMEKYPVKQSGTLKNSSTRRSAGERSDKE
ncbi:MAG: hypothetical protein ACE5QV_03545, partial [Fidelibacterota bacterium]